MFAIYCTWVTVYNSFVDWQACSERDEWSDRVKSLKEMVSSLESELQSSTSALKEANEEASRYRSKANQLQGIVESAERTRQQQQKGIKKQATSMQEAQATITRLTSRNGEYHVPIIPPLCVRS